MDFSDTSQQASSQDSNCLLVADATVMLIAHLSHKIGALGGWALAFCQISYSPDLAHVVRQRFLAIDVHATLQRLCCGHRVDVIGGTDYQAIQLDCLQHFPKVAVLFRGGKLIAALIQVVLVDIAKCEDVFAPHGDQVVATAVADANESQFEFFIGRSRFSRGQLRKAGEGRGDR